MQTKVESRTEKKLTELFTANTGASFLDSGSAYGRNWERNQGLTSADFDAMPSAIWERNEYPTINAWHYLRDRLEFSKTAEVLTRLMHVWELQDYGNRNLYDLYDQTDYLAHLGATFGEHWNTYNWETLLSQTIQGVDFELMGNRYTLLQVHGGCDVRGGYTLPVIFEVSSEYWLAGASEVNLWCDACNLSGRFEPYDRYADWYRHGELPPTLFGEPERCVTPVSGYETTNGCPECGGDLTAEMVEGY